MMDITPVSQQNMLGDRYNTSSNLNPTSGIGELQSNLRTISRFQQMIQPLGIDGIYGPETEEAVNTFKKIYHLPTYEDEEQEQYETWSAIRDVAQEYINTQTPGNILLPVTSSAQLKKLNRDPQFHCLLSCLMNTISTSLFQELPPLKPSNRLDAELLRRINLLGAFYGRSPVSEIDIPTWNIIADAYNATQRA